MGALPLPSQRWWWALSRNIIMNIHIVGWTRSHLLAATRQWKRSSVKNSWLGDAKDATVHDAFTHTHTSNIWTRQPVCCLKWATFLHCSNLIQFSMREPINLNLHCSQMIRTRPLPAASSGWGTRRCSAVRWLPGLPVAPSSPSRKHNYRSILLM